MRGARLVIVTATLAAAVTGCGGSGSQVERAVSDRYGTDVTCESDHVITVAGREATVYSCARTSGAGDNLCVVFSDGRLLGARELKPVGVAKIVCQNQG